MKKKISYALGSVFLLLMFFVACNKDPMKKIDARDKEVLTERIPEASDDLQKRMEQRAIIGATVIQNTELLRLLATAVHDKITENPRNDEAITFDEIAREKPAYVAPFARAFKSAYKSLLLSNRYFRAPTFKTVKAGEPSGRIQPSDMPTYDPVFYLNDAAQIYFPYSENFDPKSVTSAAITYHPLKEVEQNEAFMIGGEGITVFTVDEKYAEDNPVFVVNFEEIFTGTDDTQDPPPPPPPPVYQCNWLVYNTYSDVIDDRYVISTHLPKIKLLKNFRSWIGGSNYLTMLQCYAKPGNLNPNPSPALDPITANMRYVCKDFRIKRNQKGKWVDFGQIYNDDWRLIQYDNPMIIYSKQGWFYNPQGDITVNVSGGVKLDTIKLGVPPYELDSLQFQWSTSFSVGATASIKLHIGSTYEYRGSDYVTRRGMLANIVDDNFGQGTAIQAGESVPWTVRKVSDVMLYYFKIRECH